MSSFRELKDFESRFAAMDVPELNRWKTHWTQHAQNLAPKVRKEAMRRVHKIEKAIHARLADHIWTLAEIAALVPEPEAKKRGPYKKREAEISN